VSAITGKIKIESFKIGEAWISKDGIKKLIKYLNQ
jgi:transcriptional pleiotropic regulator of transition state genes